MRKHLKQKKGKRKPYVSEYQRRRIRKWFRSYKAGKKCERCDEEHPACIEFHHLDPDSKDDTIHSLIRHGVHIDRIKKELDKCVPLCANCHKKEHWGD